MEKELKTTTTTTPDDSHNPKDTISAIEWYPTKTEIPLFACSSWDSKLNIYTLNEEFFLTIFESITLPSIATGLKWVNNKIYYSSPDGSVNIYDIENEKSTKIGSHTDITLKVTNTSNENSIFSASANGEICLWDLRDKKASSKIKMQQKINSLDYDEKNDVVAYTVQGSFKACNIKGIFSPNMYNSIEWDDGTMNSRAIVISGNRILIGGTFGEIYIFSKSGTQDLLMTNSSNCKRNVMSKNFTNYNINCVDISPTNENFFQIGGNRLILYNNVQMATSKFFELDANITACKFSPDGKYTAFATGYDYSFGQYDRTKYVPEIFLHEVKEINQVKNPLLR